MLVQPEADADAAPTPAFLITHSYVRTVHLGLTLEKLHGPARGGHMAPKHISYQRRGEL